MNKRKFEIGQRVEVTKGLYKGLVGKVTIKSRYEWRNDSELMSTRAIYARIIERKNEVLANEIRTRVNVICNELEQK